MRPIPNRRTAAFWPLLMLLLAVAGCGGDDGPTNPGTPLQSGTVNEFVNELPDWEVPDATEEPPVTLETEEDFDGNSYVRSEMVEYDGADPALLADFYRRGFAHVRHRTALAAREGRDQAQRA